MATGILALGLIITAMAGFRLLLLIVDLITGHRPQIQPQFADILLIGLTTLGILLLILGLYLVKTTVRTP